MIGMELALGETPGSHGGGMQTLVAIIVYLKFVCFYIARSFSWQQ